MIQGEEAKEKTCQKDNTIGNSPRLRLGLLGCGRVVERYHLPALRQSADWTVVAACDPQQERRAWVRQHHPQLPVFESSLAMHEQSTLDAVLVATPPLTHVQLVIQALEMGTHVLVEKPMALTSSDAKRMLATSLRVQRYLGVGFSRRFRRCYVELEARLASYGKDNMQGIFFDVSSDQADWRSVSGFLGDDRQGGGVLDDIASHQLDLLPRLTDHAVSRVRARRHITNDRGSEWVAYEAELVNGLTARCRVGHGRGRHDELAIRLKDRILLVYRNRVFETRYLPRRWSRWYGRLKIILDAAIRKPTPTGSAVTLFVRQLDAFAAAVQSKERPLRNTEAERGCKTVRAVEACRQSLQCGGDWISL